MRFKSKGMSRNGAYVAICAGTSPSQREVPAKRGIGDPQTAACLANQNCGARPHRGRAALSKWFAPANRRDKGVPHRPFGPPPHCDGEAFGNDEHQTAYPTSSVASRLRGLTGPFSLKGAVSKRPEEVNLRQPLHFAINPYEGTKKGGEKGKQKQTGEHKPI